MTGGKFDSADEILQCTDPQLLRLQRLTLLGMIYDPRISAVGKRDLEGLMNFLDEIADYMADRLGMKKVLLTEDVDDHEPVPQDNKEKNYGP